MHDWCRLWHLARCSPLSCNVPDILAKQMFTIILSHGKNVGFTLKEKIQNMEDIWTILCLLGLASKEEFVFSESELELEHRHLMFWRDLTIQYLQPLGELRFVFLLQNTVLFLCRKAAHFCETQEERRDLSDNILLSSLFEHIIVPSVCRREERPHCS